MTRLHPYRLHRSSGLGGFTLLEVLIAILVLSIGLLGLAGLQFSALRSNTQSYERSQAVALAYEIVDKMRVNRVAASEGRFNLAPFEGKEAVDCIEKTCTREEAAASELAQWLERVENTLPSGSTASITQSCAPGIPCLERSTHTVRVLWNENRSTTANDPSCLRPYDDAFDPEEHLACVELSISP